MSLELLSGNCRRFNDLSLYPADDFSRALVLFSFAFNRVYKAIAAIVTVVEFYRLFVVVVH